MSRDSEQGNTLGENMNDTAASANEITSNIDSVNRQVLLQGRNVKEAQAAIGSINTSVQKLASDIQGQSNSVSRSSAAIEEMVANIRSVTGLWQNRHLMGQPCKNTKKRTPGPSTDPNV